MITILVPQSPRERREWEEAIRAKRFLPFQARWIQDRSKNKIGEKSRQLGFSWADAYDSVAETSAVGWPYDCWVSSRDQIQAQLYAQDCAMWARALNLAAGDLGESVLALEGGQRISAAKLPFANGRDLYSLSSNADAQAGKRGTRKLDEFALNPENRRLYAIAKPGITWGGRLVIFSTHRGTQNYFNELIEEAQHKGNPKNFSVHRVTLADALQEGLLVKLKETWAKIDPADPRLLMDEDSYLQMTRDECPDEETFLEEYMCQPSSDEAAFLSYEMILACRHQEEDGAWETDLRAATGPLYVGVDVGRDHDLTVIWVLEKVGSVFYTRRVIEMKATSFAEQRNRLFPILDLPGVQRCCIDATGLGRNFAEDARERFGWLSEEVKFTAEIKERMAYPLRAAFEDRTIRVPDRREIVADLRSIRKETTSAGNIRFAADRGKNGHADRFWALALALHGATNAAEAGTFRAFEKQQAGTWRQRVTRRGRRGNIG